MSQQQFMPAPGMTESLQRSWRSVTTNIWLFAGFTVLYYIASIIASRIPFIGSFAELFSVYSSGIDIQRAARCG